MGSNRPNQGSSQINNNTKLFISAVDSRVPESSLEEHFKQFGTIRELSYFTDKRNVKNGFLSYSTHEECQMCIVGSRKPPFNLRVFFAKENNGGRLSESPQMQKSSGFKEQSNKEQHLSNASSSKEQSIPEETQSNHLNFIHNSLPTGVCIRCSRTAQYVCGLCKLTWYCSMDCQTSHWIIHCNSCYPTLELPRPPGFNKSQTTRNNLNVVQNGNAEIASTGKKPLLDLPKPDNATQDHNYSQKGFKDKIGRDNYERRDNPKSTISKDSFKNRGKFEYDTQAHKKGERGPTNYENQEIKSHNKAALKESTNKNQFADQPIKKEAPLPVKREPDYTAPLASSLKYVDINTDVTVKVTYIFHPHAFYLQREKDATMLAGNQLNHSSSLHLIPNIGDLCSHLSPKDNQWYRAEVLKIKIKEQKCLINYLDYGCNVEAHFDQIYRLPAASLKIPKLAVKCQLDGLTPVNGTWTPESIEHFNILVEDQVFKVVVKKQLPSGILVVELRDIDGEDLKQIMVSLNGSAFEKESDPISSGPLVGSIFSSLSNGDNVNLHVVYMEDSLFCALTFTEEQEFITYANLEQALQDYEHALLPLDEVTSGDIVAAYSSLYDKWYRAQVIEAKENEVEVLFFDYGNSETVKKVASLKPESLSRSLLIRYSCVNTDFEPSNYLEYNQCLSAKITCLKEDTIEVKVSIDNIVQKFIGQPVLIE